MHHPSPCTGMMRSMSVAFAVLLTTGCGIGYRYGHASLNYSTDPTSLNKSNPINQVPFEIATNYHELRVVDTTGVLIAGLTNAGRQTVAASDAMNDAKNRRDTDGDGRIEVDYSYKPVGIYPGTRVVADLRIGTGPELTFEGSETPSSSAGLSYWGADVMGEFYQFDSESVQDLRATLFFAVNFENIGSGDGGSINFLHADMTFGSNLGYHIAGLTVVASAGIGLLTPLFKLLVDAPETHYLNGTLGLEAIYYPLSWLGVSANLSAVRGLSGGRNMDAYRGGLGIVLEYNPSDD